MFKKILLAAAALSTLVLGASAANAGYGYGYGHGYGYGYGYGYGHAHYTDYSYQPSCYTQSRPVDHPRVGRLFLRIHLPDRLPRLPGLRLADLGARALLTLGPIEGRCLSP